MKKILLVISIALSGIITSCQVELLTPQSDTVQQQEIPDGVIAPEITAHLENGTPSNTKTILEVDGEGVGTIYWKPADEINIFYGTSSTHYTSQNDVNATTAVFTTSDVIGSTESASENIWGLYPYNSSATCTGSAVITTLPATQYGVPGTFDDDLFITLAHNTSTVLKFYNVCGGIKFSLSRDDITSITFRGNNNEDIAGTISLNFVNDVPNVGIISGEKTITITPKTGESFAAGEYYYIILCPITLDNGFKMSFTTAEGQTGILDYTSSSISIKRSKFGKKEEIDSYATFPIPRNQIWYTSTDGNIVNPITTGFNNNKASIVSNIYADGKGIVTFDQNITSIVGGFYKCSTLQTVTLPDGLNSVGQAAFSCCWSLQEVNLPDTILSIEEEAFSSCTSLSSMNIPEGVTSVGVRAFEYCSNLQLNLPNGINSIGNYAFDGCSVLQVDLPSGLTELGTGAFTSCDGLDSITIPLGLTIIGEKAFKRCTNLQSVTIPGNVSLIGSYAFQGCTNLQEVSISGVVTKIGSFAFEDCSKIESLSFPDGLLLIGDYAFKSCTSLGSISIPATATTILPGAFKYCSGLKSTPYLPDGLVDINSNLFEDCYGLQSITFPRYIKRIGSEAFKYCFNLKNITIPSTVTHIYYSAFIGCSGIKSITMLPTTPPEGGDSMFPTTGSYVIYVPAGSVNDYKEATYWSNYASRIQAMP